MLILRKKCFWAISFALVFLWSFSVESTGTPSQGSPWNCHVIDDSSRGADGVKLEDINQDGFMDITTGWEEGGITKVYMNPGYSKARERWTEVTVGKTRSVEDAVFVDLDDDGATDVVSCCEGGVKTVFVNWAPENKQNYLNPEEWKQEAIPISKGMMKWMFAVAMQVDGKNGIDLIAAGKGDNAQIGWFESPKNPRSLSDYKWHSISYAGWIMSLILSDMDNDGDVDIVTTDRFGKMRGGRWLENPGRGSEQSQKWKNHFIGCKEVEVMFMTIFDLDKDGLKDVLVAAKPKQIIYLRRLDKTGQVWEKYVISFPNNTGTAKGVAVGDIDKDGNQDIVFSCEHAEGEKSGVMWMSYQKDKISAEWIAHEISGKAGIKFDRIELLDINGDDFLDILTCEEREKGRGMGVFWYENPYRDKENLR